MSLGALKKLVKERNYSVKGVIAKAKNQAGQKKALIFALESYDADVDKLNKKSLEKLEKIANKEGVTWTKPRGKAGEDKKKAAIIEALMASGYNVP
jgi:hypothetical protein